MGGQIMKMYIGTKVGAKPEMGKDGKITFEFQRQKAALQASTELKEKNKSTSDVNSAQKSSLAQPRSSTGTLLGN